MRLQSFWEKQISSHSNRILNCISSSCTTCAFDSERRCLYNGRFLHKSIAGGHDSVNRGAESVEPSCGKVRSAGAVTVEPVHAPIYNGEAGSLCTSKHGFVEPVTILARGRGERR